MISELFSKVAIVKPYISYRKSALVYLKGAIYMRGYEVPHKSGNADFTNLILSES